MRTPWRDPRKSERFWMVKGAGPTQCIHATAAEATKEAKRLALLNPGEPFYVLEAISVHVKHDVDSRALGNPGWRTGEDDYIPFAPEVRG